MSSSNVPQVRRTASRAVSSGGGRIAPFTGNPGGLLSLLGGVATQAGVRGLAASGAIERARLDEERRQQAQINNGRVAEVDSQLADSIRKALLDGDAGYLRKKGRVAIDGRQQLLDQLTERREELLGSLDNEDQQDDFDLMAERRMQRALEMVDGHYAKEVSGYELAGAQARADKLGLDAQTSLLYGSDDDFTEKRRALFGPQGELRRIASLEGMHPDEATNFIANAENQFYLGAVGELIEQDPQRAGEAIETATKAGRISQVTADKLRADLKRKNTKVDGHAIAMTMRRRHTNLADAVGEMNDMLTRKEITPEVLAEAIRVSVQDDAITARSQASSRSGAWERALNEYSTNNGVLSAEAEKGLDDNGLRLKFDAAKSRGELQATTAVGRKWLATLRGDTLRSRFDSAEEVYDAMLPEMGSAGAAKMVARYEQAGQPASRDRPEIDTELLIADGLREVLGLPRDGELDENMLRRWTDSVNQQLERVEYEGTPQRTHWLQAIEKAKTAGPINTGNKIVPSSIATQDQISSAMGETPDGQPIAAQLDEFDPESNDPLTGQQMTYRDQAQRMFGEMASMTAEQWEQLNPGGPEKPQGYVVIGNRVVPHEDVTVVDVTRAAHARREAYSASQKEKGVDWLRQAYRTELRKAILKSVDQGTGVIGVLDEERYVQFSGGRDTQGRAEVRTFDQAPTGNPLRHMIHREAVDALLQRHSEWGAFGVTQDEAYELFGLDPEQIRQERINRRRYAPRRGEETYRPHRRTPSSSPWRY